MRRLVTQFDDRRTRATLATPTCCCCCCCCLATIVSTTVVTTLNAHELAGRAKIGQGMRWLYRVGAVLVLPLALVAANGIGLFVGQVDDDAGSLAGVLGFFVAWTALLLAIYKTLAMPRAGGVVALTIGCCTTLFCVEFVAGGALVLTSAPGPYVYLALVIALPFGIVPVLRRLTAIVTGRRP